MLIKEVEKIIRVKQFVAFDGNIYEDASECREHEAELHDNACEYVKTHCVKSFSGLDIAFLGESGSEYNVYYVIDVKDIETVSALQFLLLMYEFNESEREALATKVNNAFNAHARVLISNWDDDGWEWHGNYLDCLGSCSKDLHRIFADWCVRED